MRMVRSMTVSVALLLVTLLSAFTATAQSLITGLSFEKISITSDFTGTELVVFGTVDGLDRGEGLEGDEDVTIGRYDIVVVIEGPREPSVVRKKARTAGIWINRDTVEFDSVPASYLMMTTKPVDDPQFQQALSSLGIGLSEITFNTNSANADAATDGDFRDAVVRLKMTKELYWEGEGIRFLGDNLFRARFKIPALVPIGVHQVRSYLLLDNQLVSGATQAVNIKKTGFEQFLYRFAHDYGFLYGVVCVILAILTGWLSSVIFRRD